MNIKTQKILLKWKPVLNTIISQKPIISIEYTLKYSEIMCLYAEQHMNLDLKSEKSTSTNTHTHTLNDYINKSNTNILPLALKLFTEINIDDIINNDKFILSETRLKQHLLKIKISYDEFDDHSDKQIHMAYLEDLVRKELVTYINKELKYSNGIKVYKLCDYIFLKDNYLHIISDFETYGTREEKLKRILWNGKI